MSKSVPPLLSSWYLLPIKIAFNCQICSTLLSSSSQYDDPVRVPASLDRCQARTFQRSSELDVLHSLATAIPAVRHKRNSHATLIDCSWA